MSWEHPAALPVAESAGSPTQLHRVAGILGEIGSSRTLKTALARLGRGAITLLGGAQAAVRAYRVDDRGSNLAYWVAPDGSLTPADAPDPPPTSIAGQLLAGGPPRIVDDLWALDPADSPLYPQLRERGLRSSVAVPIVAGEERIGSLHVDHPMVGYYTSLHLALAEALAIQAGAAIERTRQAARRAAEERLRAMYEDAREQTDTHVALNASLRDLADEHARLLGEARAALRARDDFLNAAAHELKTPMTSIMGLAQLVQRRLASERPFSPDELRLYISRIGSQTARLSRVVDQLLEGAQLQAGALPIFPRPTDLCALVHEAVDLLMIDPAEQPIIQQLPPQSLIRQVDPVLFRQVILTLLDNAVRAHRDARGAARAPIEIRVRPRGSAVVLEVRDHGDAAGTLPLPSSGISQDRSTLQLAGAGLGFAIARHVVEQHGGTIAASHARGGGTRVTVTLPDG